MAIQNSVTVAVLPIDPLNSSDYHYTYCADADSWEINTALESGQQAYRMAADGGNEADKQSLRSFGS